MEQYVGELIFRTYDVDGAEHDFSFDCSFGGMAMHQIMSLLGDQEMYLENEAFRNKPKTRENLELLIKNLTGLIEALGLSVDEAVGINEKYDNGGFEKSDCAGCEKVRRLCHPAEKEEIS